MVIFTKKFKIGAEENSSVLIYDLSWYENSDEMME